MKKSALVAIAIFSGLALWGCHHHGAKQSGSANSRRAVEAFYSELLSDAGAPEMATRVRDVVAEDWLSTPQPVGGAGAEGLIKTLEGFSQLIPDLAWEPIEIIQANDGSVDRWIVRGRATGTPTATFLGIEPTGKGFDVMTIDIHTVEDGKITTSFHVEEWAKAMEQLAAD